MIRINEKEGNAIVASDLHGDFQDYLVLKDKWEDDNPNSHLIILGDNIDGYNPNTDQSLNILDDIKFEINKDNFHVLSGNHENSFIRNETLFRMNKPITNLLKNQIRSKNKGKLEPHLSNYIKLFKKMPLYVIINDIFFSHAGPSNDISKNKTFNCSDFSWNRPQYDYSEKDVDDFLNLHNLNHMVIGHEHLNGWGKFGKQYLIAPHTNTQRYYMDIDLNDTECLDKYIKKL